LTTIGASQAAWSADGKRIAFFGPEKIAVPSWLQVYVMDADGGNVRMVTRIPNAKSEPCWSPDGAAIAFTVENTVEKLGMMANLFQVDADGGNLRRLTAGPKFDGRPAYSPDGSKLAFHSNRDGNSEIYVMNLR